MNTALEQHFQVETEIIGPDAWQQLEARVFHRVIRWEKTGITWEPDPRHVEFIIEQKGFKGAKQLKSQAPRRRRRATGNCARTST